MCGFDSIPFDVGTLFGVNRLRHKMGKPNLAIRRSTAHVSLLGGMSGGSVATGINNNENPVMLTAGVDNDDPFLLGGTPKGGAREEDMDDYVNFVGELGWELHHPIEYQNHIFDKLMDAGEDFGLKPFGIRAMESLRVEKTYKLVGTEMSIEYAAFESGLERFVHLNKGNFIGRDALVKWQQKGFKNKMVMLEVHDIEDADVLGNNPIYSDGKVIGRATGGNYGFRVKKSLAIGMVEPQYAKIGQNLEMDILDKKHKVTVIEDSPYDPNNEKLKA